MADYVRSFFQSVRQHFAPRIAGRRTRSAFLSLFQRLWRTIPSYLPFYIIVLVLLYATWFGVRPATVITTFHLPPETKGTSVPFSGETVSRFLQDAITSIRKEAQGALPSPPCDFIPHKKGEQLRGLSAETRASFEVRGPVTMEVKGISPEALVSAAREVLGKERLISGDVVLSDSSSFQLVARADDGGPWMTSPRPLTLAGLKEASCELAESVLGATNKNVLAAAWIQRGKYDDVIKLYGILPSRGGDPDSLNNLGVALRMKCVAADVMASSKQECPSDDAIARFRQALRLRYRFSEAHYNLALALRSKGLTDAAIAEYRQSIVMKPDYAFAHNNLANLLAEKMDYDEAISEYRKAIELNPDYTYVHLNLGMTLQTMQRSDEAIAEFRAMVKLEPEDADAHNSLGTGLAHRGQYNEAIDEYRLAIKLKPNYAGAHNDLGAALDQTGRYNEAVAEFGIAIKLDPRSEEPHYNLAISLKHEGQYDNAIAEFRSAIGLNPNDPAAHYNLGLALAHEGHCDAATVEYREALELNHDYADARDALTKALCRK